MAYGEILNVDGKDYMNVTPNMTSDTKPEPYRVTCGGAQEHGPAYMAFADKPPNVDYWHWVPIGLTNNWIQLDFNLPTKIDAIRYSLGSAIGIRAYGSNDGVTYDPLFSFSVPATNDYSWHLKQFDHSISYRYYKFDNFNGSGKFLYMIRFFAIKNTDPFLIEELGILKTIKGESVVELNEPISEAIFKEYGFKELSLLDGVINSLSPQFNLLKLSAEGDTSQIKATFVARPQLIIPTGDLRTSDLAAIKTASIVTTGTTGIAKVVLSFDKGATWKTFKDGSWQDIALTTEAVGLDGILHNQLSAIPEAKWAELLGKTLRFAYYLEKTAISDDLAVDALSITADMKGTWCKALHGTDYDYEYASSEILNVKLLKDGSYKINTLTAGSGGGYVFSEILQPYDWHGEAAPYELVIRNSIIKANDIVELAAGNEITSDQLKQLQTANIIGGAQTDGSVTLLAYGEKPTIAIPVQFLVRNLA